VGNIVLPDSFLEMQAGKSLLLYLRANTGNYGKLRAITGNYGHFREFAPFCKSK
jgi:hypothetical protein